MPRKRAALEPPSQPAHHILVEGGKAEVTLGREFTADEEQWLHDHIVIGLRHLDSIALSTAHVVHVKAKFDGDEQGEQIQTNRPVACPDCGTQLQAGADQFRPFDYLACPRAAPLPEGVAVCDWGCVVACGVPPPDPTIVRA